MNVLHIPSMPWSANWFGSRLLTCISNGDQHCGLESNDSLLNIQLPQLPTYPPHLQYKNEFSEIFVSNCHTTMIFSAKRPLKCKLAYLPLPALEVDYECCVACTLLGGGGRKVLSLALPLWLDVKSLSCYCLTVYLIYWFSCWSNLYCQSDAVSWV